jgi:hypothetical protein
VSDLVRRVRELGGSLPLHIVGALAGISQRRSAKMHGEDGGTVLGHSATELKKELKKSIAHLQTLRDEVRIRLHLGSLDLKDQWKKLEPHLGEVEKRAEELTEASRAAVVDAVRKVEAIRSSLSDPDRYLP